MSERYMEAWVINKNVLRSHLLVGTLRHSLGPQEWKKYILISASSQSTGVIIF